MELLFGSDGQQSTLRGQVQPGMEYGKPPEFIRGVIAPRAAIPSLHRGVPSKLKA